MRLSGISTLVRNSLGTVGHIWQEVTSYGQRMVSRRLERIQRAVWCPKYHSIHTLDFPYLSRLMVFSHPANLSRSSTSTAQCLSHRFLL